MLKKIELSEALKAHISGIMEDMATRLARYRFEKLGEKMLKKIELSEALKVHIRGIMEDMAAAETAIFVAAGRKKCLSQQLWKAVHDEHPELIHRSARLHTATLDITFVAPSGPEYACPICMRRDVTHGDPPLCADCSKWGDEPVQMVRMSPVAVAEKPKAKKKPKRKKKNA